MDTSLMTREEIDNRLQELEQNITALQLERNNGSLTPEIQEGLRQAYQEIETFRNATQQTITNDNRIKELEKMIQEKQNTINSMDQAIGLVSMGSDSTPDSIKDEVEARDNEERLQNEYKEELNKLLSDLPNLTFDSLNIAKDINSKRIEELADKDRTPEEEAEYKDLNNKAIKIETEFLRRYANNNIYKNQEVNGLVEQKRNARVSLSLLAQRNTDTKSEEYELEKAYAKELVRNLNLIECEIERQRPLELGAMTDEQLGNELDRLLDLMEVQNEKNPYDPSRPFVPGRNNELYNLYVEKTNSINEELTNRKNNVNTRQDPNLDNDPDKKKSNDLNPDNDPDKKKPNDQNPDNDPDKTKSNDQNRDLDTKTPHLNNTIGLARNENARECIRSRKRRNKTGVKTAMAVMTTLSLLGGAALVPALVAGVGAATTTVAISTAVDLIQKKAFDYKLKKLAHKAGTEVIYDYEAGTVGFGKRGENGKIEYVSNSNELKDMMINNLMDQGIEKENAEKEANTTFNLFSKNFEKMSKKSLLDKGLDFTEINLSKDLTNVYDMKFGGVTPAGTLVKQTIDEIGNSLGNGFKNAGERASGFAEFLSNTKVAQLIQLGDIKIKNNLTKLQSLRSSTDSLSDVQKVVIDDAIAKENDLTNKEPSKIIDKVNDLSDKVANFTGQNLNNKNDKTDDLTNSDKQVVPQDVEPQPEQQPEPEPQPEPQPQDVDYLDIPIGIPDDILDADDLSQDPSQNIDINNQDIQNMSNDSDAPSPLGDQNDGMTLDEQKDALDKAIRTYQANGMDEEAEALRQQLDSLVLGDNSMGLGRY